jgi:tetratricopeptide (TPR) repeat protein
MAGRFRPLAPDNRDQARQPAPPPDVFKPPAPPPDMPKAPAPRPEEPPPKPKQEELPPRPEEPKPKPPVRHVQELPLPPEPDPNPNNEAGRQIALGRAAFAAGEYGRAAHHFRLAAVTDPMTPIGHFLLAQALFALGKYEEAVATIHAGLRLQPDWPQRRFRPLELYGDNVADYPEHLARLEEAATRQPDDPVLLFLYAYQLWFDGRQDEALPVFQRAARVLPDKGDVERFLEARPPGAPLI